MVAIGMTTYAWYVVIAIACFSLGEMLISPKKNEFMGNIAPQDKKAMYLGFVMLPQGIGWGLEGYWGPKLYEMYASKEVFARQWLAERGMELDAINAIPEGEAFHTLVSFSNETAQALTQAMYQTHHVGFAWLFIAAIGSFSTFGILIYGRWLAGLAKK